MEKEFGKRIMTTSRVINTKDIMIMIRKMVMENFTGNQVMFTKEIISMMSVMAMVI